MQCPRTIKREPSPNRYWFATTPLDGNCMTGMKSGPVGSNYEWPTTFMRPILIREFQDNVNDFDLRYFTCVNYNATNPNVFSSLKITDRHHSSSLSPYSVANSSLSSFCAAVRNSFFAATLLCNPSIFSLLEIVVTSMGIWHTSWKSN